MFLNYDCMRDVLISLEKHLSITGGDVFPIELEFSAMSFEDLLQTEEIQGYQTEDVFYAVHNLQQAGYICADILWAGDVVDECTITDITYSGHMFLRSIHDETIWTSVKKRLGPMINASLPIVSEVASQLILQSLGK